MSPELVARLADVGIQVLAEARGHYLFGRDETVALVERTETGCGSIGGTGLMTEHGLSFLVWRENRAFLAAKGMEVPAAETQVAAIRRFSEDLQAALR
ncbi:MAG TPA: hypothetical protein VG675_15000 [Bryobacteraceae bacterium]|nr:hypothetical protein [Bryobacteraceae bacterium]